MTRTRPRPSPSQGVAAPAIPSGVAEGGASFEAEIRWAYDALTRGETALAKERLRRVLAATKPQAAHRVRRTRRGK